MTECQRIIESGFLSPAYLSEEIRNDYMITSEMKKVWTIELDLLRFFSELCEKHHLQYWVGFGTLLGAVRHHGFIPWDDDVDVWMPREDYEKLLAIPGKDIPETYFIQTTLNDQDYYSAFARLRNSNTTGILVSGNNRCNNGIYIDIYPLDGMEKNLKKQKRRSEYIRALNVIAHAHLYNVNPHPLTRMIHAVTHLPFAHLNCRWIYTRVNELAGSVDWKDTDRVGIVVFWPYPFEKTNYDKKWFAETISMPFEGMTVNVPKGYDRILTTLYGNYMVFPPVEKRGSWHDFTFYPDIPYTAFNKTAR